MNQYDEFLKLNERIEVARYASNLKVKPDFVNFFTANKSSMDGIHLENAIWLLGICGNPQAQEIMADYLSHPIIYVRSRTAASLSGLSEVSNTVIHKALEALLDAPNEYLTINAVYLSMLFDILEKSNSIEIIEKILEKEDVLIEKYGKELGIDVTRAINHLKELRNCLGTGPENQVKDGR